MKFLPLASSSAGNAYVAIGEGLAPLLLDCGLRFAVLRQALWDLDLSVSDIGACLLTHNHGDHMVTRTVEELLRRGVRVAASKETLGDYFGSDPLSLHVRPQEAFTLCGYRVMPFSTVHDAPGALGFTIADQADGKLLFLTDTAYSPFTFEGLTHVAVECNFSKEIIRERTASGEIGMDRYARTVKSHMSLETLVDMLKANDLSRVQEIWLLHLSDMNSDEKAFGDAVRKATGRPVYVASK